jgi:hypothetical protein
MSAKVECWGGPLDGTDVPKDHAMFKVPGTPGYYLFMTNRYEWQDHVFGKRMRDMFIEFFDSDDLDDEWKSR